MAQLGSSSLSAEIETLSHVLSLVEAFRAFDGDNDSNITVEELGGILGSLGYNASEQDVRAMTQHGDANKDGLLSMQEFLEMNTKDMGLGVLGNYLRASFDALSAGNQIVTGDELYGAMANDGLGLSLEDCQVIIASMDGDGDGAISLEDFVLIVDSLV